METRTFLPLNAAPKAVVSAPIRTWRPVAMWRAHVVISAVRCAQPMLTITLYSKSRLVLTRTLRLVTFCPGFLHRRFQSEAHSTRGKLVRNVTVSKKTEWAIKGINTHFNFPLIVPSICGPKRFAFCIMGSRTTERFATWNWDGPRVDVPKLWEG